MTKILVADDEMDFLFTFRSFFESRGYKVFIAPRGMDAIEYLRTERPEVMVLDLKMRDMYGMDVLRKAREIHPSVKTFVVTGSDEEDLKEQALGLGAVDYLTKPIRLADLESKIADIVK